MNILKQSTSANVMLGPFLDDTDGKTAEGALSIANTVVWLSKNGGDFAYKHETGDLTADDASNAGWYKFALDSTDTDTLGNLVISVHVSGALPCYRTFTVLPANVFDSLVSTDKLQVDAVEINSSATAAANQAAAAETVVRFTALTSSTSSKILTALSETTVDHYKGKIVQWRTGALAGQASDITQYDADGSIHVTTMTDAPANGDTGVII